MLERYVYTFIHTFVYIYATNPPKPMAKPLLVLFRQVLYPTAVQTNIHDSEYCLLSLVHDDADPLKPRQ